MSVEHLSKNLTGARCSKPFGNYCHMIYNAMGCNVTWATINTSPRAPNHSANKIKMLRALRLTSRNHHS